MALFEINIHFACMHKASRFAPKKPPRESIICGWVVGWWITKALIMLKFLLKNGQKWGWPAGQFTS